MKLAKSSLALVLVLTIALYGCNPSWIQVALNDLPVLIQMAVQIASLFSVVGSGTPPSPAEMAAIQNISDQARADLMLIQTLYNQYKVQPSDSLKQQIIAAGNTIVANLPQLLAAAHIKDQALLTRVTAAVTLVIDTVTSLMALIPGAPPTKRLAGPPPSPKQLRAAWAEKVCQGAAGCELK